MRVRIEEIPENESDEIIVRCRKDTPEIRSICSDIESLIRRAPSEPDRNASPNRPSQRIGGPLNAIPTPEFYKGEEQYYLSFSEILFFETEGEKVIAHTATDSYETKQRLYELASMLPGSFVRISRSSIANVAHIFSIQKGLTRVGLVTFRGSYKEVYVSRKYVRHALIIPSIVASRRI